MNSHERKFSWMGRGLIVAAAGLALAMVGPGLGEAVAGSPACPTSITSCGCAITSAGTYTVANDLAASQGMTALGDCIDVSVSGVTLNLEGYNVENDNGNGNVGIHVLKGASGTTIIGGLDGVNLQSSQVSNVYNLSLSFIEDWNIGLESDGANTVAGHFVADYNAIGVLVQKATGNSITGFGSVDNYEYGVWLNGATGSRVTSSVDAVINGCQYIGIYLGSNKPDDVGNNPPSGSVPTNNNFINDNIAFDNFAGVVIDIKSLGNQVMDNVALYNEYDLTDFNPNCGTNRWVLNVFDSNQENPACID